MLTLHLFLLSLRGFLDATRKYTGRTFQERTLPTVDHRRMNAKPARQLSYHQFYLQHLKRRLHFELRRMALPFRNLGSPSCQLPEDNKS